MVFLNFKKKNLFELANLKNQPLIFIKRGQYHFYFILKLKIRNIRILYF